MVVSLVVNRIIRKGEVGVEPCVDFPKFQEAIKSTHACYELRTPHLLRCLRTLVRGFEKQGMTPKQISELLTDSIRVICPECFTWTGGAGLVNLLIYDEFTNSKSGAASHNQVRRLYYGFCPNSKCESRRLILIWQGDPEMEEKLRAHLKTLRTSREHTRQLGGIQAETVLTPPDVLSFTKDTLYTLQQSESSRPLFLQGVFPGVSVWVSVVTVPLVMARNAFPGGYPSFLKQLLSESRKIRKDVSVAHWISTQEDDGWNLSLAFSPPESLPREEQYLILPPELL